MKILTKKYTYVLILFLLLIGANKTYCIDNKDNINRHSDTDNKKLELIYTQSKDNNKNNKDSNIKLSELGLDIALRLKNTEYQIKFLNNLINNYNALYNNKMYEHYTLQLIDILQREKKYKELSSTYLNFSGFYGKNSNYDKSFIYTNKLIDLSNKTGDSLMLAKSFSNLGTVLLSLNDYKNALIYLKKGLHLLRNDTVNKSIKVSLNNNIAIIYANEKQYNKSLEHQLKALKLLENTNNYRQKGITLLNIAQAYTSLFEYQKAIKNLNSALNNALKSNDKLLTASVYKNLGHCHLKQKEYQKAYEYLRIAESISSKTSNYKTLAETYELLSDYYLVTGNFKLAYQNYEKFQSLNDSIFKNKGIEKVSKLKISFETKEKEKENHILKQKEVIKQLQIENQENVTKLFRLISILCIAIVIFAFYRFIIKRNANIKLSKKNELILKHNQQLEELNKTKDKFFSIIANDINQPFFEIKQNIEKLTDNLNDDEIHKIAENIEENSIYAGKLLFNLLIWAKVQRGIIEIKKERLHLATCVESCIKPFKEIADKKNHKTIIDINENQYVYADKYTFDFIISSIYNNSVKFTKEGGIIEISSKFYNSNIDITIKDNGIGIDKVRFDKLFNIGEDTTTLSTENKKGSGLGLHICNDFIRINEGKMHIESQPEIGTTVIITFPAST